MFGFGSGRFGMVHKCVENSSGLTLAAKVIKTRNQKEKVNRLPFFAGYMAVCIFTDHNANNSSNSIRKIVTVFH